MNDILWDSSLKPADNSYIMQKDNSEKSTAIKVFVRVRPLVGA